MLNTLHTSGTQNVYSHDLANLTGVTAAQVRRDLMEVGYSGSPTKGYDVVSLMDSIGKMLDAPEGQGIALVAEH